MHLAVFHLSGLFQCSLFLQLLIFSYTCTAVLKLGWVTWVIQVNQVMFFLGHLGQTRFKNYPGLTQIGLHEM